MTPQNTAPPSCCACGHVILVTLTRGKAVERYDHCEHPSGPHPMHEWCVWKTPKTGGIEMIDINELRQSLGAIRPEEVAELLDRLEAAEKERDFAKAEIARLHDDIRELTDVRVLDEEDRERIVAHLQGEAKAKLDRLEAVERELVDLRSSMKFRTSLIGRTEAERDALRAKVAEMEQQKPVGKFIRHPSNGLWEQDGYGDNPDARPLYALPGAKGE